MTGLRISIVRSALCAALLAPALGCVSRTLYVDSSPAGAEVRVNGEHVGSTPVLLPFKHYGVYSIELRKEGFAPIVEEKPLLAPWYARFPLCLFSELLLPVRITDSRELLYNLRPPSIPDRAALLERAREGE